MPLTQPPFCINTLPPLDGAGGFMFVKVKRDLWPMKHDHTCFHHRLGIAMKHALVCIG